MLPQGRWPGVNKDFFEYAKYSGIGISWVLGTAAYMYLGYVGGNALDRRLGTTPIFLMVCILLAMGLSLQSLAATVAALMRSESKLPGESGLKRPEESDGKRGGPPQG
jgi:F0F1-type ATP synthase assembly protein I